MDGEVNDNCSRRAERGAGLSFRSGISSSLSVRIVAIVSRLVYMPMSVLKESTLLTAVGRKGERGGGCGGV